MKKIVKRENEELIANSKKQFETCKERWFALCAYCILSLSVAPSTTCFTAISNILQYHYGVQPIAIHVLLGVSAVAVLIFNFPAAIILHKCELGFTLKMSACINLIGAIIRYFSYDEHHGYYLLLVGNILSAVSLASYMFLPGKVAQNWFPEDERGLAIGVGVGFDMLSVGTGFLLTTLIVHNQEDKDKIASDLKVVNLVLLTFSIVSFVTIMFVKSKPNNSGNNKTINDQIVKPNNDNMLTFQDGRTKKINTFMKCIKTLLKHKNFLIIVHLSSIAASIEVSFEMILNDILVNIFPGTEKQIGIIGFLAVLLGFVSNIIVGLIIDKTAAYKKITVIIFSVTLICLVVWTFLLQTCHSFIPIGITFCILIMTVTSYYSVACSHIVTATHPVDSGTSLMLLMTFEAFYILLVSISSSIVLIYVNVLYVNVTVLFIVLSALLLTAFITPNKGNLVENTLSNEESIAIEINVINAEECKQTDYEL